MADDIIKGIPINSAGFGTISKLAMQDRRLHIAAKAIYAYFNSYAGGGDACFPSRKKICFDLGISNDTLSKYLRQLTECGYISVEQIKEGGRFSHNVYTLNGTISPCPKISDTEKTVNGKLDTNINNSNINSIYNNNSIKREMAKPTRHRYGEYNNVLLSDEELEKIKTELPNNWEQYIQDLSSYMASTGKSYKSHIATIRNWARKDQAKHKERTKEQPQQETDYQRANRENAEKFAAMLGGSK